MIVHKIAAGTLAGALAVGLAVAPATAKGKPDDKGSKVKGTTSIMFTKSVKKKFTKNEIRVTAVAPAKKQNKVKFTFPATKPDQSTIDHTGGLEFAGKGNLTITDLDFDLKENKVGTGLTLDQVKIHKKTVTARLYVTAAGAEVLNDTLGTTLFKDGMFLAKSSSKF